MPPAKIQTRPFAKPERIENARPYGNKPVKPRNNTILDRKSYEADTIIKTNEENERNNRQLSSIISKNGREVTKDTKTPENEFRRNTQNTPDGSIKHTAHNRDNGSIRASQVSNEDYQRRRRNSSAADFENGNRKESPRDTHNNSQLSINVSPKGAEAVF